MIKPLGKRLVVKQPEKEETTVSGFIVPTQQDIGNKDRGEVVAVGPEVTRATVGQTVVFTRFAPSEATVDGSELLILHEDDILAVLK